MVFEPAFFRNNRLRLATELRRVRACDASRELVVVPGMKELHRFNTDSSVLFPQESNFWYLTGVTLPGCALAVELDDAATSTLFVPPHDPGDEVWHGPTDSHDDLKRKHGFDRVVCIDDLKTALDGKSLVLTVSNGVQCDELAGRTTDTAAVLKVLTEMRMYKQPEELQELREINRISSEAHVALWKAVRPGMTELDLEGIFRYESFLRGARFESYPPIVGAGPNAAVLHYGQNQRRIEDGDLVLVDAGAERLQYSSDITRCFPANGTFTPHQRTIYNIVLDSQLAVLAAMRPGVDWVDMHRLAERVIARGLHECGILQGDLDAAIAAHAMSVFFPHGLGHFLGLDTHDVGGYPEGVPRIPEPAIRYLRARRQLAPGMVITVEPGVYFIPPLIRQAREDPAVAKFINFDKVAEYTPVGGVRIEDDVIVTEDGIENMTTTPKEVEAIERIMAEARK